MIFDIERIERKIGYDFKNDKMLLKQCFTHSSYAHETGLKDNERLEFFGDAILDFIVTEYLVLVSEEDEGRLTKRRADLVSREPLQRALFSLDLQDEILFGKSFNKFNLSPDDKIYSNIYEAIVAGIYIDGGLDAVREFIRRTLIEPNKKKNKVKEDEKSALQEYVQKYRLGKIGYKQIYKKGPDHNPEFKIAVTLNDEVKEYGIGGKKQEAERQAAGLLLAQIKTHHQEKQSKAVKARTENKALKKQKAKKQEKPSKEKIRQEKPIKVKEKQKKEKPIKQAKAQKKTENKVIKKQQKINKKSNQKT